jgi:hypothetical protein
VSYLFCACLPGIVDSDFVVPFQTDVLTLAGNKLTGTIPTEIGNSPRLNSLLLGRNYLSGSLPTEMENLQTLEMFHIGKNQLSGTVPEFAGRLNKLGKICYLYLYSSF